jgi:pimeloyl-ACP methyl ester carboxylesterase
VADGIDVGRRLLLGAALLGTAGINGETHAQAKKAPSRTPLRKLEPLRHVETDILDIACYEAGPASGPAVILLHGFPYDIHTYADVAPILVAKGCRVIVPNLRGYGETRFRDTATLRSGEQAALGADVIALTDALGIKRAVFAGHNWGGRAATVAAALWPERCAGLVTVNSYLIQDLSRAMVPASPENEEAMWYE